jgi:hypothetical protein
VPALVAALNARGRSADVLDPTDPTDAAARLLAELSPGDTLVVMTNGSLEPLLRALAARVSPSAS